ncbi:MAG: alpha/beta hydrolase [Acutalibacteraceae bacterium]|jgi:hypothetical protein
MKYFVIALICILVLFLLVMIAGAVAFHLFIVRPKKPPKIDPNDERRLEREKIREKNNAYLFSLNPEDVSIKSSNGLQLKGWFLPSKSGSKRFAVCVHGYRCNGPDEFSHMVPFYHDELDYNLFLPDNRAHGRSEGNYIGFGALDHKDILLWLKYLIERFGEDIEIILHGISMGAATVMLTNSADSLPPQVKIIIEDCGYSSAIEQFTCQAKEMFGLKSRPLIAAMSLVSKLAAGYFFSEADCVKFMKKAKRPVLFIHGGDDTFVPTYMVYLLHDACTVPKDLLIVDGAVHAFSYYQAPELYQQKVKDFIATHMD